MTQPEALRLAHWLERDGANCQQHLDAAAELRRLHHNIEVLTNALWKACGDDDEIVNLTIASQGELK